MNNKENWDFDKELTGFRKHFRRSLARSWAQVVVLEIEPSDLEGNVSIEGLQVARLSWRLIEENSRKVQRFLDALTKLTKKYPDIQPFGLDLVFGSLHSKISRHKDVMTQVKSKARSGAAGLPLEISASMLHILIRARSQKTTPQLREYFDGSGYKSDQIAARKLAEEFLVGEALPGKLSIPTFNRPEEGVSWAGGVRQMMWRQIHRAAAGKYMKTWTEVQKEMHRAVEDSLAKVPADHPSAAMTIISKHINGVFSTKRL